MYAVRIYTANSYVATTSSSAVVVRALRGPDVEVNPRASHGYFVKKNSIMPQIRHYECFDNNCDNCDNRNIAIVFLDTYYFGNRRQQNFTIEIITILRSVRVK